MSFSSRVIAISAPPASAPVRHLGLMLWSLPILISLLALLMSPRNTTLPSQDMVNNKRNSQTALAAVVLPELVEPQTFARIGEAFYTGAGATLAKTEEPRFPMLAEAWKPAPFSAGKIAMKVDHEPVASLQTPRAKPAIEVANSDILEASRSNLPPEGGMREFQRVRAIGATALQADNIRIVLAGVEPLPEEATCRRLDGVMQSCIERAEHRLAVLLQARNVSCQLSRQLESGVFIGRCLADKIDIASDLLRQKLAQRRSSVLASNNR